METVKGIVLAIVVSPFWLLGHGLRGLGDLILRLIGDGE